PGAYLGQLGSTIDIICPSGGCGLAAVLSFYDPFANDPALILRMDPTGASLTAYSSPAGDVLYPAMSSMNTGEVHAGYMTTYTDQTIFGVHPAGALEWETTL